MTGTVQVTTTSETKAEAMKIATALVDQRLAACVQISGPINSCYRWRGNVETAEEWLCTIKTTEQSFGRVELAIRKIHSYEEPEIMATPIVAASSGYLAWLRDQVGDGEG
jgi:periplasmic divalent cation tolerance protein